MARRLSDYQRIRRKVLRYLRERFDPSFARRSAAGRKGAEMRRRKREQVT